jgi:hypothetical protein
MSSYAEDQQLLLKYKTLSIETRKDYPIADMSLSIADINRDSKNEIIVSGNGYIQIFDWNGQVLEPKWKSPQYSYPLGFGNATFSRVSNIVPAIYYINKKVATDYLYFGYKAAKSSDIYKITWKKNKYELEKISASPFNWFDFSGICGDGSTVIIGSKQHEKGNYITVYKWNGSVLLEAWKGAPRTDIKLQGEILRNANKSVNVFLGQDNKQTGVLSCSNGSIEWNVVDPGVDVKDLMEKNRIDRANGKIGFTKKGSIGELWSIQSSGNEYEYNARLFVSKFDGKKFSSFSKVTFNGVDSDMIFDMIIADVDNDGIGEILGVEEKIRKKIPRNNPGDTGEEGDTLLITSNLFLAKWTGKEYDVKWHRKAVEERLKNVEVGDVTGDGKLEILVTDENGYLYVFDMPAQK